MIDWKNTSEEGVVTMTDDEITKELNELSAITKKKDLRERIGKYPRHLSMWYAIVHYMIYKIGHDAWMDYLERTSD